MIRLNLIPEVIVRAQAWRRRIRHWVIAIVVSAMGLALPLAADGYQYNRIRALRAENHRLQDELRQVTVELQAVMSQARRALTQLEHADALRAKRAWSGILAMIGMRLPSSCWLTSLATDPTTPTQAPTSSKLPPLENTKGTQKTTVLVMESPRKLRMVGFAPDAALPHVFVRGLKETNLFAQVSLSRSIREQAFDGQYFRFELECEW